MLRFWFVSEERHNVAVVCAHDEVAPVAMVMARTEAGRARARLIAQLPQMVWDIEEAHKADDARRKAIVTRAYERVQKTLKNSC